MGKTTSKNPARQEIVRQKALITMPCGTHKGFRRHIKSQEKPCPPCKQAEKEHQAQRLQSAIDSKDPNGQRSAFRMRRNPKKETARIEAFHALGLDGAKKSGGKNYIIWKKLYAEEARQELKRRSIRSNRIASGKRKARLIKNGWEKYTPSEVFDRYGILCYLCSGKINYLSPRSTGVEGWESGLHFDHKIPVSRGGADTLENIRPSHAICNLRKGSKLLEELPLDFFSREII